MAKHTFGYETNHSSVVWDVEDIWKAAEKLPTEMYDVGLLYKIVEAKQEHFTDDDYDRIKEADTSYPIITNGDVTIILDGVHRIFKLKDVGGEVSIKRLKKMPKPIEVEGKPFKIKGLSFDWPKGKLGKESFQSEPKSFNW